uniref:Uncharacterized protein n=1 Tax=Physcomitrium patens TaxID=3218 RepID=A0A2K1K1S2_PHYPA|nr:hypothetical protein PHYPA_012201 [Physcomitrium patens]
MWIACCSFKCELFLYYCSSLQDGLNRGKVSCLMVIKFLAFSVIKVLRRSRLYVGSMMSVKSGLLVQWSRLVPNLAHDAHARLLARCENKTNPWELTNVVSFVRDASHACIVTNKMVMIVARNALVSVLLNILHLILFTWCTSMALRQLFM